MPRLDDDFVRKKLRASVDRSRFKGLGDYTGLREPEYTMVEGSRSLTKAVDPRSDRKFANALPEKCLPELDISKVGSPKHVL